MVQFTFKRPGACMVKFTFTAGDGLSSHAGASTLQAEEKAVLSGSILIFKKKGYYSNKKVFLIFNIKKNQLTKKRNLVNLNTRECSKKKNIIKQNN